MKEKAIEQLSNVNDLNRIFHVTRIETHLFFGNYDENSRILFVAVLLSSGLVRSSTSYSVTE